MYRSNGCKRRLKTGQPVYGLMHALGHAPIAEMIGQAGYDFVLIDGEHGLGGSAEQLACLQAVAATPSTGLIRVCANDPVVLKRVLDLGVEGVLIPDVATVQEARRAVEYCRYPPGGRRGYSAGTIRASDYGLHASKYLADDGSELLVGAIIESASGVRHAAAIAEVDGIDLVQIGPFDLSCDLGIPGQFDHPRFQAAVRRVEAAVHRAGKWLGGVPLPGLALPVMLQRGYRFITLGADVPMLQQALALKDLPSGKSEPADGPGTAPTRSSAPRKSSHRRTRTSPSQPGLSRPSSTKK